MAVFTSIEEVIANARTIMESELDGLSDPFLRQWAYLAQRQIGVTVEFLDTVTINVVDFTVLKPTDFIRAEDMGLYNSSDNELGYIWEKRGERVHYANPTLNAPIYVSEDNFYYHLDSNSSATYAKLRYYSLPIDDAGLPLIPEKSVFATMMFLRYMVAFRNKERERDQYKLEWEKEAAKVRSKDKLPDQLQFQNGIAKRYQNIIRTPQNETF
jgi:hypothetical protein